MSAFQNQNQCFQTRNHKFGIFSNLSSDHKIAIGNIHTNIGHFIVCDPFNRGRHILCGDGIKYDIDIINEKYKVFEVW